MHKVPWRRTRLILLVLIGSGLIGAAYARKVRWERQAETYESVDWTSDTRFRKGGTLVICGGGPLPDDIRQGFLTLGGDKQARLVVIPGSPAADDARRTYFASRWQALGPASVYVARAQEPAQPEDLTELAAELQNATAVWMGGGSQSWLASRYVGTDVETEILKVLERGGVVGGTSAGAAIMSPQMIVSGWSTPVEGLGLPLFPGAVIDQHFFRRNRLGRLERFLDQHSDLVGFGIDESTALIVTLKTQHVCVAGKSYVMACVPGRFGGEMRREIMKDGDHVRLADLRDHGVRINTPADLDDVLW